MNPRPHISLRRRLLVRIIGILASIWLAATVIVMWGTWHEAEEAYSGQVLHMSAALAEVLGDSADLRAGPDLTNLTADQEGVDDYFVIVTRNGEVIYRSDPVGMQLETPDLEPGAAPMSDRSWQIATTRNDEARLEVTVGLEREEPLKLALQIAASVALPMLLGFIAIVVAIVFGVRHALRPLNLLRVALVDRSAPGLSPIDIPDVPEEVSPIIDELNKLFGQVNRLIDNERRLIADASHELRTPLTAIKAHAQNLDETSLDPASRKSIAFIRSGVDRSTRLIEQLLLLARLDDSEHPAPLERLDLLACTRSALSEYLDAQQLHDTDLALEGRAVQARVDQADVFTVVRNLVDNAIRHGGAGVSIRVRTACVSGRAALVVSDSGPGIPIAEREKVLGRFSRGVDVRNEGSGLGLAIVAAIAEKYGGWVTMEQDEELGGLRIMVALSLQSEAVGPA